VLAGPILANTQNSQQQSTQTTQTASSRPTPDRPEGVNPPVKGGKDYVIGPDDVLDVNVWKEQELTRSLQVRPDGKISMPLLGDVQAAGLTPGQLAQNVSDKLKKYLTAPQVYPAGNLECRRTYSLRQWEEDFSDARRKPYPDEIPVQLQGSIGRT
jgi:polysaccharide export outer membrane protein